MRRVVNRKPRILVVDDDPLMCDIIAATLEDAYELAIVTDGLDVRERMWAVDPDLVILDCNLPGRPGMMVLEDIRTSASNAAIPVMMLTGRQGNWTQSAAARLARHDGQTAVVMPASSCVTASRNSAGAKGLRMK